MKDPRFDFLIGSNIDILKKWFQMKLIFQLTFEGHTGSLKQVLFTKDGNRLVIVSLIQFSIFIDTLQIEICQPKIQYFYFAANLFWRQNYSLVGHCLRLRGKTNNLGLEHWRFWVGKRLRRYFNSCAWKSCFLLQRQQVGLIEDCKKASLL